MSDSPNARKVLRALLAICSVTTLVTVAVIGFLVFRKPSPATLTSKPAEVVQEIVESVPIVLSHEFTSEESRMKWGAEVPHGTQVLDNVTFFVDGGLRVASLTQPKHPGALLGIPIRQRGTRIHLLQAAENVGSADAKIPGTIYGRLRFHFGNGQSRDTYLRYGVHGFDWWQVPKQLSNTVSDPNTTDAWVVPRRDGKIFIRLHHTALENPFPNEEIMSFDAISPLARGNILLFAVSVDSSPAKLHPPLGEEWPADSLNLAFSLKDAEGKPVSGGTIRWETTVPLGAVSFPPFPCDGSGRMNIDFATRAIRAVHYTATDQRGNTASGIIAPPDIGWSPTQEIAIVLGNK
ncbi:MAG TPA: hypothetical protein VGF13_16675 [Verrucomicrobiae bacterium]|jgi:hypothetical protein